MAEFILEKDVLLGQYGTISGLADITAYSSKTNPDVTPVLEDNTDCLFTVHMESELQHIKDCSRVLFFGQAWTREDVEGLLERGIEMFVVDNEPDLDTFLQAIDRPVTLFLRVKLKEFTLRTERHYVFGMPTRTVEERLRALRDHEHLTLGIHFHRKTQNVSEWRLEKEFVRMFPQDILDVVEVVNIGGGIPSTYANTNKDVIPVVHEKIRAFREWLNGRSTRLMIEPGRALAAPSCKLKTTILGVHGNTVIVDASVYNTDMDALIVPVKLMIEGERETGDAYTVKGVTPCSLDIFRYKAYLDDPKAGDELVFLNAGAYNFHTEFCSLEKIPTRVEG